MNGSSLRPGPHKLWADLLRVIAVFGVVLVHTASDAITEWGHGPASWWWSAHFYDSLARGPVPLFIMLSGALLLSKQENLGDFFRKRLKRIAVPFFFWTVFYFMWSKHLFRPSLIGSDLFRLTAEGHVYYHLWFFYILLGLYLLTPVFRLWVSHAKPNDLVYFLILCFWAASLAPFLGQLHRLLTAKPLTFALSLEPATGFIGYFVMGYFLQHRASAKWRIPAAGMAFACWLICFAGTYAVTRTQGHFQNLFYGNTAPNVVFYTASLFVLFCTLPPDLETRFPARLESLVRQGSSLSFGIYLIHPVFLDFFTSGKFGFQWKVFVFHPAFRIPVLALTVFGLSWFLAAGIQKIPGLRRIA